MNANEVELQLGARQCCHKQEGREGKGAGPAQQVPAMREYKTTIQKKRKQHTHSHTQTQSCHAVSGVLARQAFT